MKRKTTVEFVANEDHDDDDGKSSIHCICHHHADMESIESFDSS